MPNDFTSRHFFILFELRTTSLTPQCKAVLYILAVVPFVKSALQNTHHFNQKHQIYFSTFTHFSSVRSLTPSSLKVQFNISLSSVYFCNNSVVVFTRTDHTCVNLGLPATLNLSLLWQTKQNPQRRHSSVPADPRPPSVLPTRGHTWLSLRVLVASCSSVCLWESF